MNTMKHDLLMSAVVNADVTKLANEFAHILQSWATDEEWSAMLAANATETDSNVCHSHDFCDANMAMEAAFHKLGFNTSVDIGENDEAAYAAATNLWNAAWELARKRHLGGSMIAQVVAGAEKKSSWTVAGLPFIIATHHQPKQGAPQWNTQRK